MKDAHKPAQSATEAAELSFLHEICKRSPGALLSTTLGRVATFISNAMHCDSCFIYLLKGDELVLRASKNPHADVVDRLAIQVGQGITGWAAARKQAVVLPRKAYQDVRFKSFNELPEDRYEAFLSVPLLCRNRLIGVVNVQHREPYDYSQREIRLIDTIGFLIASEIEITRLEVENWKLRRDLEARTTGSLAGSTREMR